MSFAYDVKSEIFRNKALYAKHHLAQGYGLLLFGRRFTKEEISLTTEGKGIANRYASFLKEVLPRGTSIVTEENNIGTTHYIVRVEDAAERKKVIDIFSSADGRRINRALLQKDGDLQAFLGGAYLACGRITDPQKNYRLEFAVHDEELVEEFSEFLSEILTEPKRTLRRGETILYYRESEAIEDVLATVGATTAALQIMETKIYKDVRNKANRVTNCETANIDKTVNAATAQAADIDYLFSHMDVENIPEELREIAMLRLQNPTLSLRELGELLSEPLSRSGVNHRLKRLSQMAEDLRKIN